MNHLKPSDILPEPPEDLKQHSNRLLDLIRVRIEQTGPISFAEFMEMALYEPGLGYYSAGLHKFGAEGDFVTAPELGEVFAACLARQVEEIIAELGACSILEIGAGSGAMATQVMRELAMLNSSISAQCSYQILERSADLREVQMRAVKASGLEQAWKVAWLDQPPSRPWQGIILANEVVDALPVERFQVSDGAVQQVCVTTGDAKLDWHKRPAPAGLEAAVRKLGPLASGYTSEINLQVAPWLRAVTENLRRGVVLMIDYGYPQHEYYLPQRSDGTLIAHYRHRAHADLLRYPGLQDITAFVDFSALAAAGQEAGLDLLGYTSQALFLMGSGLDEAVHNRLSGDAEADMGLNNQVRQLVFPELMGEKFQVMALGRGWPRSPLLRGFSFRDLRDRL